MQELCKLYSRLLILTLIVFASVVLKAQPFPLNLSVQVNPPYSANYSSYFSGVGQVVLTVNNTSGTTQAIYLAGVIATIDGEVEARTSPESPWPGAALNVPPGTHQFSGTALRPFAENSNVDYTGITQQDILMGSLPEGDYQICMRAYDYISTAPLSAGEPLGCSNVFTIQYPPPPQIIGPECAGFITSSIPQNILFNWQQPSGLPMGVVARYRFKLVVLNDGIDAQSALEASSDPFYQTTLTTASLLYTNIHPALLENRQYAWQIQAFDPTGGTVFQNEGFSEPCTFNYTGSSASGGAFSLVFPAAGDTLPWSFMPIIHRFDPYSLNYVGHNRTFTLRENGSQVDVFTRNMNWPQGPEQSQEAALGISITQEESQNINLYKRPDNAPAPIQFQHGRRYDWDADIELENSAGPSIYGTLTGSFVSGMGKPQLLYPIDRDTVERDQLLEIQFNTSQEPSDLQPPFAIMQTFRGSSGGSFFNGGINERWLLEVSRTEAFSSTVYTQNKVIGPALDYLSGTCNTSCLIDSLYRQVSTAYTPADTGWYFWRVRWLDNPAAASGTSYLNSSTRRFYVADSVRRSEPIPPTPGECVNTCEGPVIAAGERIGVSTAAIGTLVQIGLFDMRITEIAWSGTSATGKGTINVPLMRAPMKVRFNGIRINSNNRVYEGTVTGEYDNSTIIPAGIAEALPTLTNLDANQAQNLNSFVNSAGRLVSQFATDVPTGLPIGLDQQVDDQRVTIGIVGLKFTPEVATLNAMVSLEFAELHGWLSLGAMNICFHPDGLGGDGKAMLYLPIDHDIPFADSLTMRFNKTTFDEDYSTVRDSGTYVSWDCQGFKALNLDGAVIFGRNLLVEDLESGEPGPAQIKAEFAARFRRHGQWLARLNFNHPFQLAGSPGWGFQVEEAWLDFSDGQNPDGFSFPQGYVFNPADFLGGTALEDVTNPEYYWKGFYLKRQMIRLPRVFESYSNPGGRLTAAVNNMLIDRRGLTASFRIENLLTVSDGNLSGWGFSIDTVMIDIAMNSFSRGGFVGEIRIPASDSLLEYSSMLRQNIASRNFSYELRINPKDTINADLWAAELTLAPTSYISAVIDSAGVFARAELTGSISIDAELPAAGRVNFRFMEFEELGFQTRAPYIDCDEDCVRFAFASPQKTLGGQMTDDEGGGSSGGGMSGFPVSIENIGLTFRDGDGGLPRVGLQFTLALNLTGESNTFSAATTLAVLGQLNMGGTGQYWEFSGVELDSIGISGSVGVVSLSGGLRFYNSDPVYGNGFKGFIQASFRPTISARVSAQFGEKQGMRYWFVDAQVVFNPGITLMAGLDVYGFGGGAYYHMRRTTSLPSAAGMASADTSGRGAPGMTLSGVNFVPDAATNFGFSATVIFGNTGGGTAYNADVTFGAEFSNSGGISMMYLRGNAYFMCDITDRNNPQVHAMADISYDFVHQVFDARFEVTINIAGGIVRGVNPGGVAGMIHIYASPVTWFIHVGNPETPIGLSLLSMFTTRSYLMIGLNLPSAPPPPPEVLSIITPTTVVRHPGMETGDGFAFGSRFGFDTGRLGFLMFYARLALGMGFDLSLMNYGPNVFCEGAPPGTTIGVDGWYANGQMYAYILGEIGIFVDLWFVSGEFKILEMGAAALLQGGMPNPSWIMGTAGGYYNILNGMVKGTCQFEFKVGDECRPAAESSLAGIDILSDLVPINGEQNVDCGINPEASFNAEVNRQFDVEEILSTGAIRPRRYRFVIDRFTLKKGGQLVTTDQQVSADKYKAMLIPRAFLDPFTEYTANIKIKGEEYNFSSSTWEPALKIDGSAIVAEKTHTFRTGAYPDRIPDNNVLVTYPFNTQRFYLQEECNQGFVKLKQWMAPLFTSTPTANTVRKFTVRFVPVDGGEQLDTELNFQQSSLMLNFTIPTLANNKIYACQIISKDSTIGSPANLLNVLNISGGNYLQLSQTNSAITSSLAQTFMAQNGGVQVRNNRINGRTVRRNEKLLYVFFFKTSQFNTLQQKMSGVSSIAANRTNFGLFEYLAPTFTGPEKFDVFDVNGYRFMNGLSPQFIRSLVHSTESRIDNWNTTYTTPVIYNFYNNLRSSGYTSLKLTRANPDTLGIPPTNTLRFHESNPTRNPLTSNEYLPLSSSPNSVFANLANTGINYGMPPFGGGFINFSGVAAGPDIALKLNMETSFRTLLDYLRMNTIVNSVQAYWGSPYTSEFITGLAKTQMITYITTPFKPLYRGPYTGRFYFRSPYYMCTDPDSYPLPINKTYTY